MRTLFRSSKALAQVKMKNKHLCFMSTARVANLWMNVRATGQIESGCVFGRHRRRSHQSIGTAPRFSYFSRRAPPLSHTLWKFHYRPVCFLCLHAPVRVGRHNNFLITLLSAADSLHLCWRTLAHTNTLCARAAGGTARKLHSMRPTPNSGINNSRSKTMRGQ